MACLNKMDMGWCEIFCIFVIELKLKLNRVDVYNLNGCCYDFACSDLLLVIVGGY